VRCAYTTLWNEAVVVSATGTIFPAAYQRTPMIPAQTPIAEPGATPRVIPKGSYPKPPEWNGEWTWEPASGVEYTPQWRWWDTEGGEWRYHFPDKYHSIGHCGMAKRP